MLSIRSVLVLLAITFLGCDLANVQTESAEVRPNEEVYRIGADEEIRIRVSNTSDVTLFYDACRLPKVDIFADDQLVRRVGFAECRAIMPTSLAPGEAISFEISLAVFVDVAKVSHHDEEVRYVTDFALYRDENLQTPISEQQLRRGHFEIVWNQG